jgi:phosphatidylglycerophosphate synthase
LAPPKSKPKPKPKYAYDSSQQSILIPYYKRLFWNRLLEKLPTGLSPNAMTTISTLCCGVSFVLAAAFRDHAWALVMAALLIVTYFTLDNLDGAHARRIGKSSRLGEFMDHWLDTLNNGFVTLGACLAAGLPPIFALAVLSVGNLAFFAVQWELRQTGVFRMGRIADVEGNTTVALLYLVLAVLGADALQVQPIAGLPNLTIFLGCGVMGQAAWTALVAVYRTPVARIDFAPIILAHVLLLGWASAGGLGPLAYLSIAFFLNPVFTTRPVFSRLLDRNTAPLDWMVVGFLTAGIGLHVLADVDTGGFGAALAVALGLLTLRHFAVATRSLREPPDPPRGKDQASSELPVAGA